MSTFYLPVLVWAGLIAIMAALVLQNRVRSWDVYLIGATVLTITAVLAVMWARRHG